MDPGNHYTRCPAPCTAKMIGTVQLPPTFRMTLLLCIHPTRAEAETIRRHTQAQVQSGDRQKMT